LDQDLIARFFQKQCTAHEARQVAEYLRANPRLLEQYLSTYEWNSVVPAANMPEQFWDEIWHNIREDHKKKDLQRWLKRSIAAAAVVTLIGVGYVLFTPKENTKPGNADIHTSAVANLETVENTKKDTMEIVLKDGSIVELAPGSSLDYDDSFSATRRQVWLHGAAFFEIAKDKTRPFTVYAGSLATTALGTSFTVQAIGTENDVIVKLFTGIVVITPADKTVTRWNKDIFLEPGQKLSFNPSTLLAVVEKIEPISTTGTARTSQEKTPTFNVAADGLNFSNTTLPEVMKALSEYYHVTINYDTPMLQAMHFSGKVLRTDSVSVILNVIAQMNNLVVTRQQNGFLITKPK